MTTTDSSAVTPALIQRLSPGAPTMPKQPTGVLVANLHAALDAIARSGSQPSMAPLGHDGVGVVGDEIADLRLEDYHYHSARSRTYVC